jgi:hypothetical protein
MVGHINMPFALNLEQLGITGPPGMPMPVHSLSVMYGGLMHTPLSTALEASSVPESMRWPRRPASSWVLPESSSVTAESESSLEAPLLEELLVEEPLLEELPLEEAPLDVAPPELSPPPEAPSGADPSLDPMEFEALGELVPQAGTRGAVTSAKPQRRIDRAFMLGAKQSPCPVHVCPKCLDDGVKAQCLLDIAV